MSWQEFVALMALATAMSFTPGPNTALSAALGANLGLRRALPFVFGVPIGWGLLLVLCSLGVAALLLAVPALRLGLTLTGSAYLLWQAWRLAGVRTLSTSERELGQGISLAQGVMLQFVNVKAWMIALTIISGWVAGRPDAVWRLAQVLPPMLVFALASNFVYAATGSLLRHWLAQGRRLLWFNRALALMLAGSALWMLAR